MRMRPRTIRITLSAPAAAAAVLLVGAIASTLPVSATPEAAASGPRDGGRMTGALRRALAVQRRAGLGADAAGGKAARRLPEALERHFLARDAEGGPHATFKAILATGSDAEVAAMAAAGAQLRGRVGRVVAFDAPLAAAERFARLAPVRALDLAHRMKPELDLSGPDTGATFVHDPNGLGATGAGVLVAGIDTGQDVKHFDFRKPDKTTRFRSVFNMDPRCSGTPPAGHTDGCYFDEVRINKFLRGKVGMDYKDPGVTLGHGSHTMGIAAGNGSGTGNGEPAGVYVGMAPSADLIGVKVFDNRGVNVGDLTEALQFLGEEQARLGNPPLVVNMSLGHQFGAHDGSDPDEIAIDDFITEGDANGIVRVVVKSAGNSEEDDIFTEGTSSLVGAVTRTFTVPTIDFSGRACGTLSGLGNDVVLIDLWYEGADDVTVRVTAPDGTTFFENPTGHDPNDFQIDTAMGTIFVDCPDDPYVNGDRECVLGVDDTGGVPPAAGTWTVSISGNSLPSGGDFDAWMSIAEKGNCFWGWDDPDQGNNISIPGTAMKVITVGAYITKKQWTNVKGSDVSYPTPPTPDEGDIAPFSSSGPTRDGRLKPDLAAPGMGIASARSRLVSIGPGTEARLRTVEDGKHMVLEGTSMSSPHVAGAAALLLEIDPTLTSADVLSLLQSTAAADAFTGGIPNDTWGMGKLDVLAAAGAARARKRPDAPLP